MKLSIRFKYVSSTISIIHSYKLFQSIKLGEVKTRDEMNDIVKDINEIKSQLPALIQSSQQSQSQQSQQLQPLQQAQPDSNNFNSDESQQHQQQQPQQNQQPQSNDNQQSSVLGMDVSTTENASEFLDLNMLESIGQMDDNAAFQLNEMFNENAFS